MNDFIEDLGQARKFKFMYTTPQEEFMNDAIIQILATGIRGHYPCGCVRCVHRFNMKQKGSRRQARQAPIWKMVDDPSCKGSQGPQDSDLEGMSERIKGYSITVNLWIELLGIGPHLNLCRRNAGVN